MEDKLIPAYMYSAYPHCETLAHQKAGSKTGEKKEKIRESELNVVSTFFTLGKWGIF